MKKKTSDEKFLAVKIQKGVEVLLSKDALIECLQTNSYKVALDDYDMVICGFVDDMYRVRFDVKTRTFGDTQVFNYTEEDIKPKKPNMPVKKLKDVKLEITHQKSNETFTYCFKGDYDENYLDWTKVDAFFKKPVNTLRFVLPHDYTDKLFNVLNKSVYDDLFAVKISGNYYENNIDKGEMIIDFSPCIIKYRTMEYGPIEDIFQLEIYTKD